MKVGFAVGTGRCGTKFLAELFAKHTSLAAHHERHPLSDTFHRYCKWYDIPVDRAGFLRTKRRGIELDLTEKAYSFEASAFLSLSIAELHEAFDARFVLMVRRPERVVISYLKKGWYSEPIDLDDPSLPPSTQRCAEFHHFLGRTLPRGDEFDRWNALTRVGKLGWYWHHLNRSVLEQFEKLAAGVGQVRRLEDLDYSVVSDVSEQLGMPSPPDERQFAKLSAKRPNSLSGLGHIRDWSPTEREEFEREVRPMAERLGYEWRVEDLLANLPVAPGKSPGSFRSILDKIKGRS